MGYLLQREGIQRLIETLSRDYVLLGPVKMKGEGMYSDTDVVRYGELKQWEDLEWDVKSHYSFKEALLPITQILFYFTEEQVKEADAERRKPAVLFMRSCDVHAMKRLDEIYLKNRFQDGYYKRLREQVYIVLMGCRDSCESGFCVSMGTNCTEDYHWSLNVRQEGKAVEIDSRWAVLDELLEAWAETEVTVKEVTPDKAAENPVKVVLPQNCGPQLVKADFWKEYDSRCIACGRCNFVCPTCACFTMQDIFYQDNGRAGERRRVHASCMVDGYTDVAGGGSCRKANGERMRFKVLHKISDFNKQFGYQMCVGCGRCDDICPEYISFSACVNRISDMEKEV
ncbi:MAG: anaerobic sulfite reductase subunit AsrA [Clostridium sp.]|nr:anaerobic sulfite reductase subunit AsrA [Clostridium sp.]